MARCNLGGVAVSVLVLLGSGTALAQFDSSYHFLNNGGDAMFVGVGAGGAQTAHDGIMTHVAGEDLRGSNLTSLDNFGYRQSGFWEHACVMHAGPTGLFVRFPALVFTELDGLNGNAPPVFTNPACSLPSFPLGTSGAVPYGLGPGSTASFVLKSLPVSSFVSTAANVLLSNNGLTPAGAGGTATFIAMASVSFPIASTGFCWAVHFSWQPSSLPSHDNIDGWEHFLANSPDDNQYWMMSDDEENLWQSQSVATDAAQTAVTVFPANVDYALDFKDADPVTVATLAPRAGTTFFAPWTTNVSNEFGVVLNPNGGFDVGRGSSMLSFSGKAGVANPNTGVGNQDPSLGPGVVPTLGFATWDNGGDGDGSVRLTWVSLDVLGANGGNPAGDPGVVVHNHTVRVPVVSAGLLQPITSLCFGLFGHVTRPGFIDPYALGGSSLLTIGGASEQRPLGTLPPPCLGIAINLTYGSSGRKGTLGAPGKLTFDQHVASTSGTRQLFIFD